MNNGSQEIRVASAEVRIVHLQRFEARAYRYISRGHDNGDYRQQNGQRPLLLGPIVSSP